MNEKIASLRRILDKSDYTVAVSGSGIMEEGGVMGIKNPNRAYEIERKYGSSPEYIFTSAYYNTRPEKFFQFYKDEILSHIPEPGRGSYALARMEKAGRLQCIITANVYNQSIRGGCENVISLHGSVFDNICPHCRKKYTVKEIRAAKGIPHCTDCNTVIRPEVSLFGEMVDSRIMTRTTEEIEKAQVLLLLGTTLRSDVFSNYIRYFQGEYLVIVHREPHYADNKADLVIIDEPGKVLEELGY